MRVILPDYRGNVESHQATTVYWSLCQDQVTKLTYNHHARSISIPLSPNKCKNCVETVKLDPISNLLNVINCL